MNWKNKKTHFREVSNCLLHSYHGNNVLSEDFFPLSNYLDFLTMDNFTIETFNYLTPNIKIYNYAFQIHYTGFHKNCNKYKLHIDYKYQFQCSKSHYLWSMTTLIHNITSAFDLTKSYMQYVISLSNIHISNEHFLPG